MTEPARTAGPAAGPLRFGLIGTGYWAQVTHAPALAAADGARLAAVWGRNPRAAAALAAEHGAVACADVDELLGQVDAVAFSVPPDVQQPIAVRAARAGRHLLLEKPVATTEAAAAELASAAAGAGVASVVFFTARFQPGVRAWLAEVTRHPLGGGHALWLGAALDDDSPFNTPWRRQKGGLWDVGPHAVSLLWASLGPVTAVTAEAGRGDLCHLVLHHASGASSTATLSVGAPPAAAADELTVWGEAGRFAAPAQAPSAREPLAVAVAELIAAARSGRPEHPCDAQFGADVTRVLAQAQRQLDAQRAARG